MPEATCKPQQLSDGHSWSGCYMEGGVLGWVALLSLQDSEKVATTLDKHKQGHPLGRLTPRAYVDACQPGLRPGGRGVDAAANHPSTAPHIHGFVSQWKVCISLQERVAIHQTPS